jgi:omega-6 fatty acid desaturase (delta-12 desaturase)
MAPELKMSDGEISMAHWSALKEVKLSSVRKIVSPECYKRSIVLALLWFVIDLALFAGSLSIIYFSSSILLKLLGSILTGITVAVMFCWAHDAAHGTLFKGSLIAEILGTLFMLPSLNMFRLWCYGHNRVHHGHTSFSPIDWIWRPNTPEEYAVKSAWGKFIYRCERSLPTCGLHYLLRVWWAGMIRYNPGKKGQTKKAKRTRALYTLNKVFTATYFVAACVLSYMFLGGVVGILLAVILPFFIFTTIISLFVYLHHTHPDIPFFDESAEWGHSVACMYCCTVVRGSRIFDALSHNIMVHVPHHVDIRIPFYHLKKAYADIKKNNPAYVHEYKWKWSVVCNIFKKCKLYDFKKHTWHTFSK